MAAAYATFTADGLQRYPHFVSKITTPPARSFTGPRPKGPSRCSTTPRRRHRIAGNVNQDGVSSAFPSSGRVCGCVGPT